MPRKGWKKPVALAPVFGEPAVKAAPKREHWKPREKRLAMEGAAQHVAVAPGSPVVAIVQGQESNGSWTDIKTFQSQAEAEAAIAGSLKVHLDDYRDSAARIVVATKSIKLGYTVGEYREPTVETQGGSMTLGGVGGSANTNGQPNTTPA